jgi:FlaA1/EpsC-like NDP-sugar epimerase
MADKSWSGKRVVITGVCGTIGRELLRLLKEEDTAEIIGIDNNEQELFFIDESHRDQNKITFYNCDIRSKSRVQTVMRGIDIVLHAAALKHVILNERSPAEAILTNIVGTQNIIDVAVESGVQRVIFTSSDKAVNPTNVMGTSKLMGERLMTAANAAERGTNPVFASTRFGNVLGSSGSVIPLFKRQILAGGPVTLTNDAMTRFVMTVNQAARLVMQSVFLACGGEVFVTKMPTIRIKDLAQAMIEIMRETEKVTTTPEIKVIGSKPGEKLYEELINDEEVRRAFEIDDFFSVLPAFKPSTREIDYGYLRSASRVNRIYRSDKEDAMPIDVLKKYLTDNKLV